MLKKIVFVNIFLLIAAGVQAQQKERWVDSVFQTLNVSQKIGQLFMLPVSGNRSELEDVAGKIRSIQPGSLFITKGSPVSQVLLLNGAQAISKVPLLVGMNAEWGLRQTLDSVESTPYPLEQSSWRKDSLNYILGARIAHQLKLVGVQINFAPRMDLLENQLDYLNYYSNSTSRLLLKSSAFLHGLQDNGIIACAKITSDKIALLNDTTLMVDANRADLRELTIPSAFIQTGVKALMTTHYNFSVFGTLGKKKAIPASVSPLFVTEIIKRKMGFEGLTVTDIPLLNTLVTKKKKGEIELLAFTIGNDILVNPQNPAAAAKLIKKALKKDANLQQQLDQSVRKILAAKFDVGLHLGRIVPVDSLLVRLNTSSDHHLQRRLAEATVTVLKNNRSVIPIRTLEDQRFVSISLGRDDHNEFNHFLSKYAPVKAVSATTAGDLPLITAALAQSDIIIVGIYPGAAAFQKEFQPAILSAATHKKVILCHFDNPASDPAWGAIETQLGVFSDNALLSELAAQVIFGGRAANGVSPVDITDSLRAGHGEKTTTYDRFAYALPEDAGMDAKTLDQIKLIAQEGINDKAFPGCRVLVARNRKIIYDQSFGYLTYDKKSPVTDETIYDLASVTKVSATLQTVMFMVEKGLIDINRKVSFYLPELRNSNKKDFLIKDILTHQAGLWPFLPFWALTMKDTVHLPEYYSHQYSTDYPLPVSENLFATKAMKDSLWQWIINAKIVEKPGRTPYDYRYSDMGFYIMQHLAEKILNQPMDEFLEQNIYEPMGCYTTGYQPLKRFPASRIAPTEDDKLFRHSLLIGYVHDQGAAMHGGIAGHAGLFSTANDLAKLGEMWLENGTYGKERYFKPQTLAMFTARQYETSRRGLGWDRAVAGDPNGPTSIYASRKTFGHTGFTGTCIWVDPEFDLVYVFLSNRVYPEMTNNKILNANIRPRIQDLIYKSIFNYCGDTD